MQWKINDTVICLWMGKNLTAKTPPDDFQLTTPETPLLSQQAVISKESQVPYQPTVEPLLTVVWIPIRDFNNTNWEDHRLQSSSVHPYDKDQEDAWSQNPTMQIHNNFFKRKRWTRSRTLSPVTICLNRVCSMLVQLVYRLTALKTILLYV